MKHLPLTLREYERIFQLIHGVIIAEGGDPTRSCLYFAVMGATVLQQHYGVTAEPIVGMAAYRLGASTVTIGDHNAGQLSVTTSGFHAWVEVEGVAVDFQAPVFLHRALPHATPTRGRKMMQKPVVEASASIDELEQGGTHWYCADHRIRSILLPDFIGKPVHSDLMEVLLQWHRRPPERVADQIWLRDQRGRTRTVTRSRISVDGAW